MRTDNVVRVDAINVLLLTWESLILNALSV